jgi:hypothetical protein
VVCGSGTNIFFPKKSKKAEKTYYEPLQKTQISFSWKIKYTTDLVIFVFQNRLLWRFLRVSVEALGRRQKKFTTPEAIAIFKREIFLNIRKNRNSLTIKSAKKKDHWFTNLTFFFASLWKKANPRSARYAWG